ncbi:MAG TPA: DUF4241 domain-containing protein [Pyrinomonadaceae bacterium]|jgi:hypothetical protein|nr:DUF4241 domain-containing protein [Pyrinomonadaceae bacterium]
MSQLAYFAGLFSEGTEVDTEIGRVVLKTRPAGTLTVTSGRVVACDPLTSPETEPFTRPVPAGSFPVTLSVAHFEDGDRRVAGALLRFAGREAATWEPALRPGDDPSELEEGEIFGYPVDSGTGCFMDEETERLVLDHMEPEAFTDALLAELERTFENTWSWANIEFDPDSGANLVAFSAGLGDDHYASYFGLDADGEVVCLVTDFALFEFDALERPASG